MCAMFSQFHVNFSTFKSICLFVWEVNFLSHFVGDFSWKISGSENWLTGAFHHLFVQSGGHLDKWKREPSR